MRVKVYPWVSIDLSPLSRSLSAYEGADSEQTNYHPNSPPFSTILDRVGLGLFSKIQVKKFPTMNFTLLTWAQSFFYPSLWIQGFTQTSETWITPCDIPLETSS